MQDVYVLNKNLELIGIVDAYKSLIWANRYQTVGDCELYLPATNEALNLLQKDYFLFRLDGEMICQIKKIELDTSAEEGNYLIVTGLDVKRWLDQRIIWTTQSCDGNVEQFIRDLVDGAACNPDDPARQFVKTNGGQMLFLGTAAGFTEITTEQISYKNLGEKVREYCLKYGWGYRVIYDNGSFYFQLYKGTDRSNSVIFSDNYENLATSKYMSDDTNMGNVALVAGQGEGAARSRNVSGQAESINRYEVYVDAKDISKNITWGELTSLYPTVEQGGQGYIAGDAETGFTYKMNYVNIQIIDDIQLAELRAQYPDGQIVTVEGHEYYQIYDEVIADLPSDTLEESSEVILREVIYSVYLLTRGYEKLAEFGAVTSFEGTVEPNTTFVFGRDYFLGDRVTIQNDFGITVQARITEVVEVNDDNGYSVEPKFEYISQEV